MRISCRECVIRTVVIRYYLANNEYDKMIGTDNWWAPWGKTSSSSGGVKTNPAALRSPSPVRRSSPSTECDPSVADLTDSTIRYVVHPTGTCMQVNSVEPRGKPLITLHQNSHPATMIPGSTLGAVQMGARDDMTSSFSSFVDGVWSRDSHPTGLMLSVTPAGSRTTMGSSPACTIRADGRMAVGGGPTAMRSSLVSVGMYRRGVLELPSVERYTDLTTTTDVFINGAIVYARDLDKVLISQGGSWRAIVTEPVFPATDAGGDCRQQQYPTTSSPALEDGGWNATDGGGSGATVTSSSPLQLREIGQPRKDGKPPIFGPRHYHKGY